MQQQDIKVLSLGNHKGDGVEGPSNTQRGVAFNVRVGLANSSGPGR